MTDTTIPTAADATLAALADAIDATCLTKREGSYNGMGGEYLTVLPGSEIAPDLAAELRNLGWTLTRITVDEPADEPWTHGSRYGRKHRSVRQHLVEDHGLTWSKVAGMSDGAVHGWHDGTHDGTTWAYAKDLPHPQVATAPPTPPTVADADALAVGAHYGQLDKADWPYIDHPRAVAALLADHGDHAVMAGLLHDVVEDTDVTLADLTAAGYPEEVVRAVDAVTRRDGESYMDMVRRAAADPLGRLVKLADNTHNSQPERLALLPKKDAERLRRKYVRARVALLWADGNVVAAAVLAAGEE